MPENDLEAMRNNQLTRSLADTLERYANSTDEDERTECELIVSRIREIANG